MPDYSKSKIYKLVNDEMGLVYYGSTVQPLSKRLYAHKNKMNSCKSRMMFEKGTVEIIFIKAIDCQTREELIAYERPYIENNVCVNKQIPGRTKAEYNRYYNAKHKIALNAKAKVYYQANIEIISEKRKKYYDKNFAKLNEDSKLYYKNNIEKLKIQQKEYRLNHPKKFVERHNCDCGGAFTKYNKLHHSKTQKHQKHFASKA